MSFSVVKSFAKFTRFLPCARTFLSGRGESGLFFRIGENTQNARTITRSLFFLCRNRDSTPGPVGTHAVTTPWSNKCGCGCSVHTKGEKELAAFLEEEITNESKAQGSVKLPKLHDFDAAFDGSVVKFTKKLDNETIIIKSNVNHSVDAEEPSVDDSASKEQEISEMKSKPDFTIEIEKGGKVLSFACSYAGSEGAEDQEQEPGEAYNDSFQINEVSVYEGDFQESTYSVSADIMDGYLYDLLMNYLEEKGVTNDLAENMIMHYTAYEHKLYIGLLRSMKKFVEK